MFLRSRKDVLDVGDRHNAAALASSGEVVISALGMSRRRVITPRYVPQISNSGSLRILASGGVDVRQVDTDTTLSGVPVAISDLLIDRNRCSW